MEEFENTGLNGRAWGFLVTQEEAWRRRYYFFVNRRSVRNATLYRVVRDTLGNDGGMVCLFVELHPSQLNVNIHPAKAEVRFRDDPSVYDLVRGGLQRRSVPSWLSTPYVAEDGVPYGEDQNSGFSLVGQIEDTFLLTLSEGHLYLLDQHAAEERVLYERLQSGQVQSRSLISPQVVQLSAEEHAFFDDQAEAFAACGFSAELFGPHVSGPSCDSRLSRSQDVRADLLTTCHARAQSKRRHASSAVVSGGNQSRPAPRPRSARPSPQRLDPNDQPPRLRPQPSCVFPSLARRSPTQSWQNGLGVWV